MVAKELLEARWKIGIALIVTILAAVGMTASFEALKGMMGDLETSGQVPEQLVGSLGGLNDFSYWAWSQWFGKTGGQLMVLVAALLGAGMIGNEVSKGTIFFLLSRPLARDRIVLVKYATGAIAMLGIIAVGTVCIVGVTAALGQSINFGGLILSSIQLWLGILLVLGIALLASVAFGDTVRAEVVAVIIAVIIGIPTLLPIDGWADWSLATYWSNFETFTGSAFPAKALAIDLMAAVIPLAIAVGLFRKKAY